MGKYPRAPFIGGITRVGHKTASVVVSQAFGIPAFPVDTHIHRLLKRWGITKGKNVVQTENDAKKVFQKTFGTNCIFKSFFMEENIHLQGVQNMKLILSQDKLEPKLRLWN